MRLWAEERRVGTLELLLTMPITAWQAIVGKFLASWLFLPLALVLTFPVVITVNYLGSPDNGVIFAGYVGSFLMAGAYLAISCMTSAMTRNQVVSFIVLGGDLPVPGPVRISAGDQFADAHGQAVAGGYGGVAECHYAFRMVHQGIARFAGHHFLPVHHWVLAVHHRRHHSQPSRGIKISRNKP